MIAKNSQLIKHLARLKDIESTETPRGLRLAVADQQAWLDIDEKTLAKHRKALETRLDTARQRVASLEARLGNETYTSKAPAALVEESRAQLAEQQALAERLQSELETIE